MGDMKVTKTVLDEGSLVPTRLGDHFEMLKDTINLAMSNVHCVHAC